MILLKCKMCGGNIEASPDMTVGKCRYCGSTMTLPKIDTDKKAHLFNKANAYRMNNEFDKAYATYEVIVNEDPEEAEAYWGMILSEYGIEYVEDPATHKRIPTCHRANPNLIVDSVNFAYAIQYADNERQLLYWNEADEIDRLQSNILSVSAQVEPYAVFICYKETDDYTGERTYDSVIAQDIYEALSDKGVRTFFARISLEEVLGQNYEPYIYAALTSARIMIVVSTRREYLDAVWVKNEWMRFLQFMAVDKSKLIIPAFAEMTPHELPEELSRYQSQNMSKIGAIQELVYSIKKIISYESVKKNTLNKANLSENRTVTAPLLKMSKHEQALSKVPAITAILSVIIVGLFIWVFSSGVLRQSQIDATHSEVAKTDENSNIEKNANSTELSKAAEIVSADSIDSNKENSKKIYTGFNHFSIDEIVINTDENDIITDKNNIQYGTYCLVAHFNIISDIPKNCKTFGIWNIDIGHKVNTHAEVPEEILDDGNDSGISRYYIYTNDQKPLAKGTYTITVYEAVTDVFLGTKTVSIE